MSTFGKPSESGKAQVLTIVILAALAAGLYWCYLFLGDLLDYNSLKKVLKEGCTETFKRGGDEDYLYQAVHSDLKKLNIPYIDPRIHFKMVENIDTWACEFNYALEYEFFWGKVTRKRYTFKCETEPGDDICR